MSLVDLGKRLLDAAKLGQTDEVRTLMSNGAPFTTDWVRFLRLLPVFQLGWEKGRVQKKSGTI